MPECSINLIEIIQPESNRNLHSNLDQLTPKFHIFYIINLTELFSKKYKIYQKYFIGFFF